ncbi:MAG: VOC family protein [Acidobacteriota bacterium]|nr:VOC family protein [Acidobacteriota bacterium]
MAGNLRDVGAITLFCDDLEASRSFYGEALGWRTLFVDGNSAAFDAGNTIVNLLRVEEAADLIAPSAVASREAGARMQLSIFTDDVDAACEELRAAGIAIASGPLDRPWGMRTATFHDPSGHVWEIAQEIGS